MLKCQNLWKKNFGRFEGFTHKEIGEATALVEKDSDYKPGETGESQKEMLTRTVTAIASIYKQNRGKRILVISHGGFIATFLGHVLTPEVPFRKRSFNVENAALSIVRFSEKEKMWYLVKLNDGGPVIIDSKNSVTNENYMASFFGTSMSLPMLCLAFGLGAFVGHKYYLKR